MGITNSNKTTDTDRIDCTGTFKVTLALAATPDITENPTDIVLILDRSGSMAGSALANLKLGAAKFVQIIDSTTGGQPGQIGSGSHIGIVSFSDTATQDVALTTSVADLDSAIAALNAGGSTNHADAFAKAFSLFDPTSANAKVMVMFTDGKTTAGPPPSPVAAAARAAGVIIYVIGLVGTDGIDVAALNDWASDPDAAHVAITPDAADLERLFEDLAQNISHPGATDIVIDEVLNPDFIITGIQMPTKGSATMLNATTLQWKIDELGVMGNEGATLDFFVKHVAQTSGTKLVNQSITYSDNEGNQVTFPDPSVIVDCGMVVQPEPCPPPISVCIGGCQDSIVFAAGDIDLASQGRILQLDVNVKNVCPGRRVALGVIVTEEDDHGIEYPRGLKTIVIPAHNAPSCRDVLIRCIKFVLPEELDVSGNPPLAMCNQRCFKVRLIAHTIDTDFACCDLLQ